MFSSIGAWYLAHAGLPAKRAIGIPDSALRKTAAIAPRVRFASHRDLNSAATRRPGNCGPAGPSF